MNNNFSYISRSNEEAVTMHGFTKPVPVEMIHVKATNMEAVENWVRERGGVFNGHFMGCLVSWNDENGTWPSVIVKRGWILVHENVPSRKFVAMSWDKADQLYSCAPK